MLSYNDAFYSLKNELQAIYDEREAAAIAHELMLHITAKDKAERIVQKDLCFTPSEQQAYDIMKAELVKGRPLQYVTGITWFLGQPYTVNENVLIPRPETEELVQWIAEENKGKKVAILDIGTGSGCIPVALKLLLPDAELTSCDVSNSALQVAHGNAAKLGARVAFLEVDILDRREWEQLVQYDIIVSNPPYIPMSEKYAMDANVREYEPHTALFVPNDDALLFYKAIAEFGRTHLNAGGLIYCELHQDLYQRTKMLFEEAGYNDVMLKKDMHGNWRMLKACL